MLHLNKFDLRTSDEIIFGHIPFKNTSLPANKSISIRYVRRNLVQYDFSTRSHFSHNMSEVRKFRQDHILLETLNFAASQILAEIFK